MSGGNAAAGAAGAFSAELAGRFIAEQLYGATSQQAIDKLSESDREQISLLATLAAGAAGGLVGDSTAAVGNAAQAGKNAVENNTLGEHGGYDEDEHAREIGNRPLNLIKLRPGAGPILDEDGRPIPGGFGVPGAVPIKSNIATYVPSPKHASGGWGTPMDLSDSKAQEVLNNSIQGGKQRYGMSGGKLYEFQPDNAAGWHGYPIVGTEAPANVLRELLNRNDINKSEYNKLRKGK